MENQFSKEKFDTFGEGECVDFFTRPGARIRNISENAFSSFVKLWKHFETAVKGQCVSEKAVIWEK